MSKKFAVVLAGCGPRDGAEIHESTLALFAIARNGGTYQVFAPDMEQAETVDHATGEITDENRNVLVEAARIARGDIRPLCELSMSEFDVLLFPGGFGAAKNIFTYAYDGMDMKVIPDAERVIRYAHSHGKPIGAMCIAPVMIAKILSGHGVKVTVGGADELGVQLEQTFGAKVEKTAPDGVVIDRQNKVVTTPAYMYDSTIREVGIGADALVKALLEME